MFPLSVLKIYAVGRSIEVGWVPLASKLLHQVRLSMVRRASASGEESDGKHHSRHRAGTAVGTARPRDGLAGRVPVGARHPAAYPLAASGWSSAEHSSARDRDLSRLEEACLD